ncbi:MAG: hypothetical protein RIG82_12650 [Phycisphaeraceae bacterium]
MRWVWIDRITEFVAGERCVAIKCVSAAEDVLHDHFPAEGGREAEPMFPHSLLIEGMAQTAGVLVGHRGRFEHNVVLAKIGRAEFVRVVGPGEVVRFTATLDRYDDAGAATSGVLEVLDPVGGEARALGRVDLMFGHLDAERAGDLDLPERPFVFTGALMDLLDRSGVPRP